MFRPKREKPLRYQETSDGLADLAVQTFAVVRKDEKGILLEGTCPRCAGTMTVLEPAEVLFRGSSATAPAPGGRPVHIWCSAEVFCEGRPEGVRGCGAYWTLIV